MKVTAGLTLSAMLAEHIGLENISVRSKWGQLIKGSGVVRTSDFRRIEALPRRVWEKDPTLEASTRELTGYLRLSRGHEPCGPACRCPRVLWANQAAALIELATVHGIFAPIAVGNGKALISLLAPTVVECKRPVLLVPAQLRNQTLARVLPQTKAHWRVHPNLKVLGYSELSLAKNQKILDKLQPDLLILDEAHCVAHREAARTKRVQAYLRQHPETRVVALSGTMARRSLRDYWQLVLWTHKPDMSPLPVAWKEATAWADALDEGLDEAQRLPPGALVLFSSEGEEVRDGFRRRLVETPGVIASPPRELGTSLEVVERKVVVPEAVNGLLARMRRTWQTPYGDEISEPVELWRHARELALGFFYRWEPAPPADWLEPRQKWHRYVRETLKHNRRGLDSPMLVANEAIALEKQGKGPREWLDWKAVRDAFEPNTVAEWIHEFALQDCLLWLSDGSALPGIVWVEHVAFGERLARYCAMRNFPVRYFGAGEKASAEILDATGPIIASIAAHSTGKNLQHAYARNLIVAPPSSGKAWEQILGRTHREGQTRDTVTAEVYLHADELRASFKQAIADAYYLTQTLGGRQKLTFADIATESPL